MCKYRGLNVSHWVYNKMFLTARSLPLEKGMARQDYQHTWHWVSILYTARLAITSIAT